MPVRKTKKDKVPGYEIKIVPDRESGYFAVRFPDFPGIVTGGFGLEEAARNAEEALSLTVETMKKHRLPVPRPRTEFSGQFNVRVPKGLHRALVARAEEEGVSLNAVVTYLLSKAFEKEKAA